MVDVSCMFTLYSTVAVSISYYRYYYLIILLELLKERLHLVIAHCIVCAEMDWLLVPDERL